MAMEAGYSNVVLESDSLITISKLKVPDEDFSPLGNFVAKAKELMSQIHSLSLSFVKRTANVPAHLLAKLGLRERSRRSWGSSPTSDVSSAVLADLIT